MHRRGNDEADYDADRAEQLAHRLQREHGLSRRQLFQVAAAGAPLLLLGRGALATPAARAQAAAAPP
ncbi:hypothetical protein VSS74_24350, partial [Conexibacter stalactiti]